MQPFVPGAAVCAVCSCLYCEGVCCVVLLCRAVQQCRATCAVLRGAVLVYSSASNISTLLVGLRLIKRGGPTWWTLIV